MENVKQNLDLIYAVLDFKVKESYTGLSTLNPHLAEYFERLADFNTMTRYVEYSALVSSDESEGLFRGFFRAIEATAREGVKGRGIKLLCLSILEQLKLRKLDCYVDDFIAEKDAWGRLIVAKGTGLDRK